MLKNDIFNLVIYANRLLTYVSGVRSTKMAHSPLKLIKNFVSLVYRLKI